jgi:DMSO/TMAO reductase YedYZ molybdopterin-dependent catalytic subunit
MHRRRWPSPQSRRSFLSTVCYGAAASGIYGVLPWRDLVAQHEVAKDRLIVRSGRPQDLETPAHLLDSWITPNDRFYVRSHFYTPTIDAAAFSLLIDGEVEKSLTMTLADLRRAPSTTVVATLECAGNGRAFFDPPVAGVQWQKGAVGTARWTGVRLRDLLRTAGLKPAARHLWLDGADRGVGRAPDFVRNLPIDKALDPDTLLAYEMNGEVLPEPHGFPLRAIVPGWEGAYSVKWLTHLRVSDREHDGAFVQGGYRYPRRPVAPGAIVSAAEMEPLKGMIVKSVMASPAAVASMAAGAIRVAGFAWAGEDEIAGVDVSTDGGRTWQPARLGADRARWAWRQFEHAWRPATPGSYVVMSRARDARGRMQPIVPDWNPSGYLWNAIDRVRVDVQQGPGVELPIAPDLTVAVSDDHPGRKVFDTRCLACHDTMLVSQQRLTIPGWTREVDKMIGWGAGVTDAEKQSLVQYLAARFGPAR